MPNTQVLTQQINEGIYDELIKDIYVDETKLDYIKNRYVDALKKYKTLYGEAEVSVFSAPGRSEIGGNHTDHQHGEVLAAAINKDCIAVVSKSDNNRVMVVSDGYQLIDFDLDNLKLQEQEKGTTVSLIKGVLAGAKERGYQIGGFFAYVTSDVLIGAGLSSSAAFEVLVGTVISYLYNDKAISPIEIAIIGQYAENVYFGKPCGLMDQMASSVGNLVHIDFNNPKDPVVEQIELDFDKQGYSLCITDTKGSHADLTHEYAAVPAEMKAVAAMFGKEVLREVSMEELIARIGEVRNELGDRATLRALHFLNENARVEKQVAALKRFDLEGFFKLIKESGDSSYKYLQNVYTNQDIDHQNVSVALAMSDIFLDGHGVSRVHGGGFAGTIQAFVETDKAVEYKANMERVFGAGSCEILKIRKYGGMQVL